MNFTAVNDAPTLSAPANFTVTEDVAGNLTYTGSPFADVDTGSLTVTLSIADGAVNATTGGGVTVGGTGTARTFTGTAAALNTFFTTAGSITYTTALNNTAARTLTTQVSDGTLNASTTSTVNITGVNDAPTLADTVLALGAVSEDAAAPSGAVGTLVSTLVGGQADVDAGASTGIAITASDTANGTWYYSINGGTNWFALGAVSNASARLLAADANTRVYFQPSTNYNGTVATGITFRAWDQSGGANGGVADTSTSGGATAFSTATDTASIAVTAVNDAPTLSAPATFTVTEDVAGNLTYTGSPFADVDTGSLTVTLSIPDGAVNATTGGGVTVGGTGTARTFTGTAAALNTFFTTAGNITYTGAADNTAARTLTTQVSDGTLNASTTSTVNFTTVNDAPTLSAPANFTVTEDVAGNLTYTGSPFADVDTGSLTVTLSIADGAVNATTGGGVTVGGTGTARTFTGTAAALNTFFTTAGSITYTTALNNTAARTLTTQVSDGTLNASTTSTVNVTAVNDAPTGADATVVVTEDTPQVLTAGDFGFSDVDTGDTLGAVRIDTLPAAGTLQYDTTGAGTGWRRAPPRW